MTDQDDGDQYGVEAWARVAFVNEVRRSMFEDNCLPVISPDSAREVFDEWLQGVKADAYDEGRADLLKNAADVLINDLAPGVFHTDRMSQRANPNPYRKDTP